MLCMYMHNLLTFCMYGYKVAEDLKKKAGLFHEQIFFRFPSSGEAYV